LPFAIFFSKLISVFVLPLGLCLALIIAGAVVARWRLKTGTGLMLGAVGLLCLFSAPAVSDYLLKSLEHRYSPVAVEDYPSADAIVVLGGAVGVTDMPGIEADLKDTSDRVFFAARLYRAGKAPTVMAVTGQVDCEDPFKSGAEAMAWLLQEWGVPAEAIVNISGSYVTGTDAALVKAAMEERGMKRVLLVTSASHMRRALATFQTAGIDAVPAATDYEEIDCRKWTEEKSILMEYLPDAEALARSTRAVKEYVGYVYYGWRGWITPSALDD